MKKVLFFAILNLILLVGCSYAKEYSIQYDNSAAEKNVLPVVVTYYVCTPSTGQPNCDAKSPMTQPTTTLMLSHGNVYKISDIKAPETSMVVGKHVDVYQSPKTKTIVMSKDFSPSECTSSSKLGIVLKIALENGQWIAKGIECSSITG